MSINGTKVLALNSAGDGLAPLKVNASGLLRVVAEATSVSANQINLNTDGLEGLHGTTNTTLASILVDTDAIDSSCNTIEAQSVLTASRLNNIQNKISANTDGTGDTLGQMVASTNTALATIDGVLDNAEAHLGNIDTGVDVLEACVGSNKVNVNISSGGITGFATAANQSTIIGHVDGVETSLTAITGYVDGLETLQTATNSALATMDAVLDASLVKHTNNETLITAMSAKLPSSLNSDKLKVIDSSLDTAIGSMDSSNQSKLDHLSTDLDAILAMNTLAEAHIGNIDTGIDVLEACVGSNKVNVNISSGNISGFATSALQGDMETSLDAILAMNTLAEAHIGNIDTGIDVLEACVGSNKVNVNISSGNITGFATQTTLAAAEVHLGNIETAVQLIDDAIKTEDLAHSSGDKGIPCLMVRQDSHTDLAADGDYMIPTINANGEIRVTSSAASGGATEAKQDDMETTLDAILAKNTEIETTNNANQVLLGTIDSDTDAIKTSAAALVVDLAAIEVLITAGNALTTTIDGVLDNILTKNGEIETTNNANQVLLTAVKTATELNSGARVATTLSFGTVANGTPETLPASTGLTLNNSSERLGYHVKASTNNWTGFIEQSFDDGTLWVSSGNINDAATGAESEVFGSEIKVGKYARMRLQHTAIGDITINGAFLAQ